LEQPEKIDRYAEIGDSQFIRIPRLKQGGPVGAMQIHHPAVG
jgi:hypothetical protein